MQNCVSGLPEGFDGRSMACKSHFVLLVLWPLRPGGLTVTLCVRLGFGRITRIYTDLRPVSFRSVFDAGPGAVRAARGYMPTGRAPSDGRVTNTAGSMPAFSKYTV
jgi:hypothetical protein